MQFLVTLVSSWPEFYKWSTIQYNTAPNAIIFVAKFFDSCFTAHNIDLSLNMIFGRKCYLIIDVISTFCTEIQFLMLLWIKLYTTKEEIHLMPKIHLQRNTEILMLPWIRLNCNLPALPCNG